MGAWVTYRKDQPLHVGLAGKYLGAWAIPAEAARAKLEAMHDEILKSNSPNEKVERVVMPLAEIIELLDHCEAVLHALAVESVPTRDMIICARALASRCTITGERLKWLSAAE